jgi:hypothetical protein
VFGGAAVAAVLGALLVGRAAHAPTE